MGEDQGHKLARDPQDLERLLVSRQRAGDADGESRDIELTCLINITTPIYLYITRVEGWLKMAEEAYEAALRQALEELTEVHQDAFSFV